MDVKLTNTNMAYVVQELNKLDLSQPKRLTVSSWKEKRGLSANGQIHLWFGQIAKHYGDRSALDVKNECKDKIGLPILLNSPAYGDTIEFLLHKLDYYKHSYERRMKLVGCLSVTSEMSTSEIKEFMEQMIFYWNDLGVPIKFKG
tara:strand:- start:169 stop:603 length:435 start_codon:yes stop_codon:yes gene_type:complete